MELTTSGVNVPLLRKAVEWAEAEAAKPEIDCRWDQREWSIPPEWRAEKLLPLAMKGSVAAETVVASHCDTSHCIAGYVGQMLDARYAESNYVDGVHVADFAAKALGLPSDTEILPHALFRSENTIEDVRRIAEDLAGERL